ncbi:MAG: DUF1318 domain-containing protein [Candidatus Hydrogenedentes bacterium]|nr:DUF1318 domain-containing protein [Candidatus Hydrogenedentota bacterium]
MRTFWTCMILALAVSCGTTGSLNEQQAPPVDPVVLLQEVDGALDYIAGGGAALPSSLSEGASAPENVEEARKLTDAADEMRARAAEIAALKAGGVLGEDNRGYLTIRNDDRLENPGEKNQLQQIMAAENGNRKDFYGAMARLRKDQGLTHTRVERLFAARRIARAPANTIIQLPPDGEEFARVKASPLGVSLGDHCQPGAWVETP